MIEQNYRIDMIPDGAPVVVHISQYDTTARRLSFELYNGGIAYELPTGAAASMAGTKPDGKAFLYAMTVVGNVASIDVQQQMALVAGDVEAEIQITGSDGKIGSANFVLRVERGPIDEDSVISETDLPIFEELVSDAQAAAADAQTAANEAQGAAEDAAEAASSVGSIVPASTGTTGQVLTKTENGADWETPAVPWGQITGALADQTDLQNALNAKANASNIATIESSTTASQAYSAGDHLVLNGQLYEVIADIASGETLVVGTNISVRTVGEELTALNKGLSDISYADTSWTPAVTGQTVTNAIGRCVRVGKFRYAYAVFSLGASIPVGSNIEINGIPNGYEPQTAFQTAIQCLNISKGVTVNGRAYAGKFYMYNSSPIAFESGNMIVINAVYFY